MFFFLSVIYFTQYDDLLAHLCVWVCVPLEGRWGDVCQDCQNKEHRRGDLTEITFLAAAVCSHGCTEVGFSPGFPPWLADGRLPPGRHTVFILGVPCLTLLFLTGISQVGLRPTLMTSC